MATKKEKTSRAPETKLYTLQEVAEYLGKTDRTVRQYIADGKLKATKIGQWRITEEALNEFIGLNK